MLHKNIYDIVFLADCRLSGQRSKILGNEIRALAAAGYRCGLAAFRGALLSRPRPFQDDIRRLIDDGVVDWLDPSLNVTARLLVVRNPADFMHRPSDVIRLKAERSLLVADDPPLDRADRPHYSIRTVEQNVGAVIGAFDWAPADPIVRERLQAVGWGNRLTAFDWLPLVETPANAEEASIVRARPAIGRHGEACRSKWPDNQEDLRNAYAAESDLPVLLRVEPDFLRRIVGDIPHNWRVVAPSEIDVCDFLRSIDFFVFFPSSSWAEPRYLEVLEALAAGVSIVLPQHFSPVFGEVGLYAESCGVQGLIEAAHASRTEASCTAYREASRYILEQRFGAAAIKRRVHDLIGAPRQPQTLVTTRNIRDDAVVLFVSSNGVGLGHLTRQLAVARRLPSSLTPVFLTMSLAFHVLEQRGHIVEFLPYYEYYQGDFDRWTTYFAAQLRDTIAFYRPRLVVYDGNVPHNGLIDVRRAHPELRFLWCRRAMWPANSPSDQYIGRESDFDAVIEPGEVAHAFDRGATRVYRSKTFTVDPIALLDDEEVRDRGAARAWLGLGNDEVAVLLMLGSKNNYNYAQLEKRIVQRLLAEPGTRVFSAQWLISLSEDELPRGVVQLRHFPLSELLPAFDFAVSAVGYNSFHELIRAGIPSIYVPNENPSMDDQLARAAYADQKGLGIRLRAGEVYRAQAVVEAMLDQDLRADMRARCQREGIGNGAMQAAQVIQELAYSLV